jgi:hypothetical protein
MADNTIERSRAERFGWASAAAMTITVVATLLGLDGQLGPLSFILRQTFALAVVVLIAAFTMVRSGGSRTACWAGVIASLVLLARAPSVPIALCAFVLAIEAIEIGATFTTFGARQFGSTVSRPEGGSPFPIGLFQTCLTYVALRFAVDLVPQVGAIAGAVAVAGSRYISQVRGHDANLSNTALGGPSVVMAVIYLVWSYRRAGEFGRLITAIVSPIVWFALLAAVTPDTSAGPLVTFGYGAMHGLCWLGLAAVAAAVLPRRRAILGCEDQPGSDEASPFRIVGRPRGRRLSLAAACLAASLAGVCLAGTSLLDPAAGRTILVYNHGGLDWDRPVFGRFGVFSGGMFGLLPVYCRAVGYDFAVIDKMEKSGADVAGSSKASPDGTLPSHDDASARNDRATKAGVPAKAVEGLSAEAPRRPDAIRRFVDTIEPDDLGEAQILVLINSPKVWEEAERRTVLDFVARGGSLLVLGDHTDVFGLMRGFNSLLGPLGIQFRFDSAYKTRETWRGCQAAASDMITWGWDSENPGVAVGASLELSGSARPLLVGRYAFSDNGVRENTMGSFLGNYHYDKGERLGDVVLAATATYGRGRVVVWGDTSACQGVSSYYPGVVGPMFAWLSRPAAWTERPPVRIAAALGLLAAILWLWIVRGTVFETAIIAAGLLIGLIVPWLLSQPNMDARVHIARDTFLIDRSHMPASGHYEARINSVGPLYTNLLRSGYRTADMKDWDSAAIGRARGIAFVAPQRSFNRREIEELLKAEEGGAVVLLNTGEPESSGSRRLLEAHGLALVPRPMGTVTSADPSASRREREQRPRFFDAWPIVAADGEGDPTALPGVEVIYRHGEDVVALFRRVGKGGLLLISDTRFFSDMNVEDMSGFWPGNLALIHDMFKRYLGADPDSVKPLFRSPEKPQ